MAREHRGFERNLRLRSRQWIFQRNHRRSSKERSRHRRSGQPPELVVINSLLLFLLLLLLLLLLLFLLLLLLLSLLLLFRCCCRCLRRRRYLRGGVFLAGVILQNIVGVVDYFEEVLGRFIQQFRNHAAFLVHGFKLRRTALILLSMVSNDGFFWQMAKGRLRNLQVLAFP